MDQVSKSDIKKKVIEDILFMSSDYIMVYKYNFILSNDTDKINIEKNHVEFLLNKNKELDEINLIESDSEDINKFNLHLNDYFDDIEYEWNVSIRNAINVGEKSGISVKCFKTLFNKNNSKIEKTSISSLDLVSIEKNKVYSMLIILTKSFSNIIVKITDDFGYEFGLYDLREYVYDFESSSKNCIYNSSESKIDTEKEIIHYETNKRISQSSPTFLTETLFNNSLCSKEKISYNDDGEVIEYNCPKSGIKMIREYLKDKDFDESYIESIWLNNILIYRTEFKSKKDIMSIFSDKFNGTIVKYCHEDGSREINIIDKFGNKEIIYYNKSGELEKNDNVLEKEKSIVERYEVDDLGRITKIIYDINYHDEIKYTENGYSICKRYLRDNIIFTEDYSDGSYFCDYNVGDFHIINKISKDNQMFSYWNNLFGFQMSNTNNISKISDPDQTIEYFIDTEEIISYQSPIYDGSRIYIRDKFGIPRLFK